MIKPRRVPIRTGVLVMLWVFLGAAVAYGATTINYSGKTSQSRRISFTLSSGYIKNLEYRIDDTCPGGKLLFVHDSGFSAIRVKHSLFGGEFIARPPQIATAILAGRVSGKTVSGSLSDRTKSNKTQKFCTGKATFRLTHK
jgi:hypothetical protein